MIYSPLPLVGEVARRAGEGEYKIQGFTLLEVVISILLMSIFATLAVTSWHYFISKNKLDIAVSELKTILSASQEYAVKNNVFVRVCGSEDKIHCKNDWNSKYIVAFGLSADLHEDCNKLISVAQMDARVQFKSSLGKNGSLVFLPTGMTKGQQGHFTLSNKYSAAEIVILMSGLSYVRAMNSSIAETK